jgi:signal transduction histidine kinase
LFTHLRDLPVVVQDGGIVVVMVAVQFIALASTGPAKFASGELARTVDAGAYALVLIATLPLLVRRRAPYVPLGTAVAAMVVFAVFDYAELFVGYAILLAVYSVSVHRGLQAGTIAAGVSFVALFVSFQIASWDPDPADRAFDLLAVATAVALGDSTRNRRRLADEQAARLRAAADEQARIAHQSVLEERARIARDLHDLVAHSMSIVAVQAGVGHHLADSEPDRAKEALATIETTTRQALTEMRRMLGVLRTTDDTAGERAEVRDPQPGSSDIAELVHQAAASGLDVELVVEPDGADVTLPAGIALSAYRIVQEALTNVRKHAGPARTTIVVRHQPDQLTVIVDDDGRGVSTFARDRQGYGLVGMRERANVVGGSLTTGPRPGGGFRVHATLPIRRDP